MKGHLRQRSNGSWELKYDLPPDPKTGERRTAFKTFRGGKRAAQQDLARLIAEAASGNPVAPSKLRVGEFLDRWLEATRPSKSLRTHDWHTYLMQAHIKPALGRLELQKLSALDVQAFIAGLGRADGKGALGQRTVRHIIATLSTALRQAVGWGLLRENPVGRIKLPAMEHQPARALDDDEVSSLLEASEGSALRTPILLAFGTGMRRGELLALRWSDMDFEAGVVTVARALEQSKAGLRFKSPKTRAGRRKVRLPTSVVAALKAHRLAQAEWRLRLGLGRDDVDLIFPNALGGGWRPQDFSEAFARLAKAAGIRCTFHELRHTHASQLLRDGVPLPAVSGRLGHASPAITLGVYSHAMPGSDEAAALQAESALQKVFGGKPVAKPKSDEGK
ncbi:MAG: tyrosine-type recombinase/integrase [Hyphomicrobium sp.]